ncbi:uncharacterized protein LOC130641507 [Hydractinia symbiolongicarpus]|uniref:uncharacterized protein LOC130641507 n=1 Tax=Hydractinia symbiolongicarpus TaxID=13093 RepID=UPI002549E11D|nr:uncharacterized protein LOC130641507 [Hydractinia symbiolongicarpus]
MATINYISIDEMLTHVGEFGLFQWLLDAMFCVMVFPQSYQVLIMYFAALNPDWQCVNGTECPYNGTLNSKNTSRCDMQRSSWEYTKPKDYSIVTEFDIICGKEWQIHLTSSIFFLSWGIGAIVLGYFADKTGRKSIIFPSIFVIIIGGLITSFLPNIYIFVVARFIVGFFTPGTSVQEFVLINEVVGSKYRPIAGNLIWFCFTLALCALGLQAYFIRQWKYLFIACTAPYIFVLLFYKFVPESVRWQRLNGKDEQVAECFRRIARWNKKEIPEGVQVERRSSNDISHHASPLDLFVHRKIAIQTLVQGYAWLVNGMVYYGLSLAADDLGGSIYANYVLLSAIEFPATLFCVYSCGKFGRKKTVIYSLIIASTTCVIVAFVPSDGGGHIARIVLGLIGKFFITSSFNGIYTWSVEIYPTNIRAEGMGFLQVTSRIGAASSPWIAKGLKVLHEAVPFAVMGTLGLLGVVFLFLLPETKGMATCESENVDGKVTSTEIGMENMAQAKE